MMHNEKNTSNLPRHEHGNFAEVMAKEIISNWSPAEQNSIVRTIRDLVINQRQKEIEETEKKLEFLRDSLTEIQPCQNTTN